MPGLTIRRMTEPDLPAVAEIDGRCTAPPWAMETFAAEIAQAAGYYTVALLDGEVVGYFGSYLIPDEAHVTTIGVLPEYRRRGVARALLTDFFATATSAGCRRFTLEVRESNHGARALYEAFGFQAVSRRRRYYDHPVEDGVVLWIPDIHALEQAGAAPAPDQPLTSENVPYPAP